MTATYSDSFYDVIRDGCRSSAAVLVPLLLDTYMPSSVLDVGCGEGWFCTAWAEAGVRTVVGVDGAYVDGRAAGDWTFIGADLEQPDAFAEIPDGFDLVTCFEVAEHVDPAGAERLVAELCERAPVVAFSAAIPGQGGTGHVNEQWPAYWASLFAEDGYGLVGDHRHAIWDDDRVEPWYRQNLLVFGAGLPHVAPPALVHPIIYEARRSR